jgi:hypothetical protein
MVWIVIPALSPYERLVLLIMLCLCASPCRFSQWFPTQLAFTLVQK